MDTNVIIGSCMIICATVIALTAIICDHLSEKNIVYSKDGFLGADENFRGSLMHA